MTYDYAVKLLSAQHKNLKAINNIRFEHSGYEYRAKYRGGFASYVAIDRRKVGTRNFKYFSGVSACNCWTATSAMKLVYDEVLRKAVDK